MGMPAFSYKERPLAGMSAFKAHASFGFWYRDDKTGKEGEAMGQFGRITSLDQLPDAAAMEAMVRAAMGLIDSGAFARRENRARKPEAQMPEVLADALARDPIAAAKFDAFASSQRREYCEWIASAKREATRHKRLAEAVAWIREGKKRHWTYESG